MHGRRDGGGDSGIRLSTHGELAGGGPFGSPETERIPPPANPRIAEKSVRRESGGRELLQLLTDVFICRRERNKIGGQRKVAMFGVSYWYFSFFFRN